MWCSRLRWPSSSLDGADVVVFPACWVAKGWSLCRARIIRHLCRAPRLSSSSAIACRNARISGSLNVRDSVIIKGSVGRRGACHRGGSSRSRGRGRRFGDRPLLELEAGREVNLQWSRPTRDQARRAITELSTPASSRSIAVEWRSTCGDTRFSLSDGHRIRAACTCFASRYSTPSRLRTPPARWEEGLGRGGGAFA